VCMYYVVAYLLTYQHNYLRQTSVHQYIKIFLKISTPNPILYNHIGLTYWLIKTNSIFINDSVNTRSDLHTQQAARILPDIQRPARRPRFYEWGMNLHRVHRVRHLIMIGMLIARACILGCTIRYYKSTISPIN